MRKRTKGAIGAGLLVVATTACWPFGGGDPESTDAPTPPPPLSSTLGPLGPEAQLYYDNGAGITDSTRLVVRSDSAYRAVWARAVSQQSSPPAAPAVDFNVHMVLVVGAGEMTPDDRIQVDSVGVRAQRDAEGDMDDHFVVVVRTVEGCRRFQIPAYPLQIVRVRSFDGPVTFVERRVKTECGDGPETGAPGAGR